ncbi:HtaA domain-containing protein [Micrococcus sp. TA1]|uniref:HtaA domain-containing protein n=1 Tax=Micrococcus sp. TA1 TaxID=681627 RepID=UPI00160AB3E8|nr:hypothetical protein [Micrococcus sp. TA1]
MTTAAPLAEAPRAHGPVPAGGLLWAVHEGFVAYVSRLADGRVDVDGGAVLQPDGSILFPLAPDGPALHGTGAVHFTGHHGLLAVTLANPAALGTGGSAVLTIDDPFTPGERLAFARLGAPASGQAACYPVPTLTEEGADLFGGHYREGTPLAPLQIQIQTHSTIAPADQDARDD